MGEKDKQNKKHNMMTVNFLSLEKDPCRIPFLRILWS